MRQSHQLLLLLLASAHHESGMERLVHSSLLGYTLDDVARHIVVRHLLGDIHVHRQWSTCYLHRRDGRNGLGWDL